MKHAEVAKGTCARLRFARFPIVVFQEKIFLEKHLQKLLKRCKDVENNAFRFGSNRAGRFASSKDYQIHNSRAISKQQKWRNVKVLRTGFDLCKKGDTMYDKQMSDLQQMLRFCQGNEMEEVCAE